MPRSPRPGPSCRSRGPTDVPRALKLDFLPRRRGAGRTGIALLAAGVAAVAGVGLEFRALRVQTEALEAHVADARGARREVRPIALNAADAKALSREIRDANEVLAQLNTPWDALFAELEAAADNGVALLSIQPDVASGQVRIAGEAQSYDAALAYVARLEATARFADVFLTSHEVRAGARQRPLAFALVAGWQTR